MKVGRQAGAPYWYDVAEFIEAFIRLDTNEEVARELNISVRKVHNRSYVLRNSGIPLPYRQKRKGQDIQDELRELDEVVRRAICCISLKGL